MNATNRVMNRVLLFLAGVVLLAAGIVALAAGILAGGDPPVWTREPLRVITDVWSSLARWTVDVAGVGPVSVLLLIAVGTALLLTVLLLVFLGTRGRGRTREVLEVDGVGGRTAVDRSVADAVLAEPLSRRPDVETSRVRRAPAIELAVTVRPGAPLGAVVAAAQAAVREWDQLLGSRVPILLHLADRGWRDSFRTATRVE
nr:hypothetical protein [Microbacterium barkeri]